MFQTILKAIVSWALSWLWSKAESGLKDYLAHQRLKEHIKTTLGEYEKLILEVDAKLDAGVPLSEEEKNEIRRKKIELEERLYNGGS